MATGKKVCVCGGAGGIGQPLCMLMAMNEHVSELCVFDLSIAMVPAEGVAADLSHLERECTVTPYALTLEDKPIEKLQECLTGCHLVLVPAGLPRKPGQDRKDLFSTNAGIAKNIVEACAKFCPDAILGLIVNPVNSVVPAMAELYAKKGLDPLKVIGVTTLDVVRANKFVHEKTKQLGNKQPINSIDIPVVGGHAGATILPLFSQDAVGKDLEASEVPKLDTDVQNAGTVVVSAKNGKGSATLSMAYAASRFAKAVLDGLAGKESTECAYVKSSVRPEVPYFTSRVVFGTEGVKKVLELGPLNAYEQGRLDGLLPQLKEEIDMGLEYAAANSLGE